MGDGTERERSDIQTVRETSAPTRPTAGSDMPTADQLGHPSVQFERGDSVGRYVILERLGVGGMGVVFSAYDPELDRRVALKLLGLQGGNDDERAHLQARLLREAQALAQLSHPNVIAVHDVGTFRDDVFIAMELIDGRTLGEILAADPPSPERALELFIQAGRGLAAAHASGLVHRDFKPDNVAVAASGRVCVLDFGLARAVTAESEAPRENAKHTPPSGNAAAPIERSSRSSLSSGGLLAASLTEHGAVMGTPSYMAPEQRRGGEVDARADQFSFCVGLYRALYGKRPFASDARDVAAEPPPHQARVRATVRRAVMKGLELDPAARHASMDALLAELEHRPARVGWWLGAAALGLAAASVVTYAAVRRDSKAPPPCSGAERKLAGVWDTDVAAQLKASFVAVAGQDGAPRADRVAAAFDAYTRKWTAMHVDACEATEVRKDQSTAMLDLRMQCLQRDLDHVGALAKLFVAHPDRSVVEKALQATQQLPSIDECANLSALAAGASPPGDPVLAAKVQDVRGELSRADALMYAGQYKPGLEVARRAVTAASAVDYPPVQAEALFLSGKLARLTFDKDAAEPTMRAALRRAGEARDRVLVARAATDLIAIVGQLEGRDADALGIADFAAAAVYEAGDLDELHGQLMNNIGLVHFLARQYPLALTDLQDALARWERALGPEHPDVLKAVNNLGAVYAKLGKYKESIAYTERAIRAQQATLGPEHPAVAMALHNLGLTQDLAGDHEAAHASIEKALAIDEKVFGPDNMSVARDLQSLATVLRALGRPADSLPLVQRALAIEEKAVGPEHPQVATTLGNLGENLDMLGRGDEAEAAYRREISIRVKAQGEEHPDVAETLLELASHHLAHKNFAEAWAEADRARVIAEKAAPATIANSYETLADVRLAEHQDAEAASWLERAIAVDAKSPSDDDRAAQRRKKLEDLRAKH
jgi:tetratricopeptide (TPR) repeat protein